MEVASKKMKNKLLLIGFIIILSASVIFLTISGEIFEGNVVKSADEYTLDIYRMKGNNSHNMNLEKGDVLDVYFRKDGGDLSLAIKDEDGDTAYFATLPVKAMVEEIKKAGVPASVSYTAGTFVCNHLMYGTLYTLAKKYPGVIGGFMHVPFITEQVMNKKNMPSLTTAQIVIGIEAAIKAIGENSKDISIIGGTTH